MKVMVLGAGSFAREVADLCDDLGWEVEAFVVNVDGQPVSLLGKPVLRAEALPSRHGYPVVAGLISPDREHLIWEVLSRHYFLTDLVHPSASVSRTARLYGCVINRGAVVGRDAVLGVGTIVNRNAAIGHDCLLAACVTVGPGACLAGGVRVGKGAVIGMGAMIREGVTIGSRAMVGMGAVVLSDIPPGEVWLGVPARKQR